MKTTCKFSNSLLFMSLFLGREMNAFAKDEV